MSASSSSGSSSTSSPTDWYLLHARMVDIDDPAVWRQFFVPPSITADQLHRLMMAAFGWNGGHLYLWSIHAVEGITGYEPSVKTDLNPGGYMCPQVQIARRKVEHPRPDLGPDYDPNGFMADYDDDFGLPPTETLEYLDGIYNFSNLGHVLKWEYDMGDGWEHIVTVERRMPPVAQITGGKGHDVAEDAGGPYGWRHIKESYAVKDTPRDDPDSADRRDWYETNCANGDKKGLKGKARLEYVNLKEANKAYQVMEERAGNSADEDMSDDYY